MIDYDAMSYSKRPWRGWVEVRATDGSWHKGHDEPYFSVEACIALAAQIPGGIEWRVVDAGGNVYETGHNERPWRRETLHRTVSERNRLLEEALR